MPIKTAGLVWFTSETYEAIVSTFTDKQDFLDAGYANWLAHAEQVEQQLIRDGIKTVRVYLDTGDFAEWAAANGRVDINSAARRDYADFIASKHI